MSDLKAMEYPTLKVRNNYDYFYIDIVMMKRWHPKKKKKFFWFCDVIFSYKCKNAITIYIGIDTANALHFYD